MRIFRWGRSLIRCVLLAALVLIWSAGPAPVALAAEGVPAAPIRLRIGVTTDGIVQVGPADLVAAGVDPATVDPRTFAMSSMGYPVAIQVITVNDDSSFDQGEYVLFFGQKYRGTEFQEKYTDERVYWLDIGGTAGPRIADVDATPRNNLLPPPDVAATVRAELDTVRIPLWTKNLVDITQDTWFRQRLTPTRCNRLPPRWTMLCPIRRRESRQRSGRWNIILFQPPGAAGTS